MLRTHIMGAICATLVGALVNPFTGQDKEISTSRPSLPHFVGKADDTKTAKAEVESSGFRSGAGYQYSDPLESRVDELEKRTEALEKAAGLAKVEKPAESTANAAPEVKSSTTVQSAAAPKASAEEVVNALRAMGYKANVSYGSNGGGAAASYGSSGSSASSYSYGSSGSAVSGSPGTYSYYTDQSTGILMQRYNPEYATSSYAAPPVVQYQAPVVQYQAPVKSAYSTRQGLFGRNYYYSAPQSCRVVNGQVICN